MSSSGPAAKRRRLDAALHKPFRSPLKTAAHSATTPTASDDNDSSLLASKTGSISASGSSGESLQATSSPPKSNPKTPARRSTAFKTGQTAANPLYKPFTPSALSHAETPASSSDNQSGPRVQDGESHSDGVAAEQDYGQDSPMKCDSQLTHDTNSLSSSPIGSSARSTVTTSTATSSSARRAVPRPAASSAISTASTTLYSPRNPRNHPPDADPELVALDHAVRTLEAQTRSLRFQIDTLRQAEGLPEVVASGAAVVSTGRLGKLMTKWRGVAQEAADEVFEDVRVRFRDVGGMQGYRRQERQRKKERVVEDWAWEKAGVFDKGSEEEKENRGQGDGESETLKNKIKFEGMEKVALQAEVERQEQEVREEEQEEDEDGVDEFTMRTMLDMLNIEPDVIGWDVRTMAWVG